MYEESSKSLWKNYAWVSGFFDSKINPYDNSIFHKLLKYCHVACVIPERIKCYFDSLIISLNLCLFFPGIKHLIVKIF